MAEDKKICSQCNQEFQDGEFLVLHKGEAYHHIKVYDRNHTSCFIKKGLTIKDVKINTEQYFYYKGTFHNINRLEKYEFANLALGINEAKTANIIRGNLDGLVEML